MIEKIELELAVAELKICTIASDCSVVSFCTYIILEWNLDHLKEDKIYHEIDFGMA
jgi:hypothetical protein